jgi:hypothetical protein
MIRVPPDYVEYDAAVVPQLALTRDYRNPGETFAATYRDFIEFVLRSPELDEESITDLVIY